MNCSRCGCSSPNPECYVCDDDDEPPILEEEHDNDWLDNLWDTEEE